MSEIIFAAIIGFVLGTLFFYYDKKSGKKLYKKWYDISNKNDLDPNVNIGFVDGRYFRQKLTVAIGLTVVCFVLSFLVFGISPFYALMYNIGTFVGILASFYISGGLINIFSKRANKTIDFIESIEKGEKNLKEEIKKVVPLAKEEPTPEPAPEVKETPEKEDDKKDDDDWRSGVKDFLNK